MLTENTAPIHDDRLSDFTQDKRVLLLAGLAACIGALSAGSAALLLKLIALATNVFFFLHFSFANSSPAAHTLGVWVILVPAVGGLIIGLMARYGSDRIRGHGIPEAIEAILIGRSRMSLKVAVLKPLSSAISIGSGGPFGAEGPIIMTGGAMGSLFAQLFHLSAAERKTLLVAGAAGGMAAVFSTPVAAVLLAVELLLFEWRPRSFIPVAVSATVAGLLRVPLLGAGPIFPTAAHGNLGPQAFAIALMVGVCAGFGSLLLTSLVYGWEDLFHKLPIHWMFWPVLGGLAVGVGGWIDPRALGVGYDYIHGLLLGQDLGGKLPLFLLIKALIWAIALGSGTSGGVLAPLLLIGGSLGALEAHLLHASDPGFWALIGMAAMMGGTMRSPLTSMIFAMELTRDISTLPALLLGCGAAHAVTVLLMRRSILTEKVARRGHHLTREYDVDPLNTVRVGEIMDKHVPTVPAQQTVAELSVRIAAGDPEACAHQALAVTEAGKLIGIVTRGDLRRAMERGAGSLSVAEAGSKHPVTAFPDETGETAVTRMIRKGVGRILVVHRDDPTCVIGYLGRSAIFRARVRRLDEEHEREPGWLPVLGAPKTGASEPSPQKAH